MDADRFDGIVRRIGRRGLLTALAGVAAALPFLRPRGAAAQVGICRPTGGVCTVGLRCCDGTPCPLNVNPWLGVCGGGALPKPAASTTGNDRPNGPRAKRKRRKQDRREYRKRRKRGRLKRRDRR